jgi:hypothetical protein
MSKFTQEEIETIVALKNDGMRHRDISQAVFGKSTAASTVHYVLSRYHPSYTGLMPDDVLGVNKNLARSDINIYSFDIETAPIKSYHWGLWQQNIGLNQIVEDWFVLMFSYKKLGEAVKNVSLRDFEGYKSGRDCEEQVVEACWEILDDADIIIGFNGRRFDCKKMNAKFLEYGLPTPSPYKIVDPMEIAKSNFALTSNKLDYIMGLVLNDHKLDTGGFGLWVGCIEGNKESWDTMREYCDKDVTGLEEVYLKLRAWDKRAPNMSLHVDDGKEHCVVCGSTSLTKEEKKAHTSVSSFEVLRCGDCGHLNRRRKNTRTKEQSVNTLMNVI